MNNRLSKMVNRSKELGKKRAYLHRIMDTLWIDGYMSRGRLYKLLSDHFGKEFHAGTSNIETCNKAIRFIYRLKLEKEKGLVKNP